MAQTIARDSSTSANATFLVGTPASLTTIAVNEDGQGCLRQTRINFFNTEITVTDALAYAGLLLYTFPAGRVAIDGCVASLVFSVPLYNAAGTAVARTAGINLNASLSWGFGSATASSITLATTMIDMLPGSGQAVLTKTLSVADDGVNTAATGALTAIPYQLDGTSTAARLFFNLGFATNTDIDADGILRISSGYVIVTWKYLGDY